MDMKLSIGLLENREIKKRLKNIGVILICLSLGIVIGAIAPRFSIQEVMIGIGAIIILRILLLFRPAYWIIGALFLLLLGPVGVIHIGGKTPNIFYEDFYLLGLLFLALTVWLQKRKSKFIVSNYVPYILLFLAVGVLSLMVTPDLLRGIGFLKGYLTGFLIFFICINVVSKEADIHKIVYAFPLFGAILGGWLYHNVSTAGTLTKAVVSISWGHSNYLATFFVFLIPMTIGLLLYKKNSLLVRCSLSASLILMIIGLISTESKSAIIAFTIALVILLFKIFPKNKLKVISIIILLGLIVILHPATKVVFHKMYAALRLRSLSRREIIYQGAIKTFLAHPLIGGGLGSLQHYMKQFTGRASYKAHSEYLHILAEMGVIGLIAMIGFLVTGYRNIVKLIKLSSKDSYIHWWAVGILAGFIGVLTHILVESSFFGYQFFIIFWVMMGMICMNLKYSVITK